MRLKTLAAALACGLAFAGCGDKEPAGPGPAPGETWKTAFVFDRGAQGTDVGIKAFWFTDPRNGWACMQHWVFRYENGSWRVAADFEKLFPNYEISFRALSAPTPNDVWAGGEFFAPTGADLFFFDGAQWLAVETGFANVAAVNAIHFLGARDGWIATSGANVGEGRVLHFDGQDWTEYLPGTDMRDFSFSAADDGWVVGTENGAEVLYRWDGSRWRRESLPGSAPTEIRAVDFTSPADGWLLGVRSGGALLYHNDGTSWARVDHPLVAAGNLDFLSGTYGWLTDSPADDGQSWLYDGVAFTPYPWPRELLGEIEFWVNGQNDAWAGTGTSSGAAYILHYTGPE